MISSQDTSDRVLEPQSKLAPRRIGVTRNAFTLIEVTLALGLVTMLMAALYASMDVYFSTATESYGEIERAQIARALLRDLARDIQSSTFTKQESMDSSDEDEDADTDVVDADEALGSYTNGLFGSDRDLVLYVSRPDRGQDYLSAQELLLPTDRSSDQMIIRYLLVEDGGGGLSGQLASEATQSDVSDSIKGLGRMQGDLMGLSNAIATGDIDMQLSAASILAPEVSGLVFRYFDGAEFLEEWDSTVQNAMPVAIEIELTLRTLPDEFDDRQPEEQPGYLPPTVHRLVVPVPVAEPYVGDMGI